MRKTILLALWFFSLALHPSPSVVGAAELRPVKVRMDFLFQGYQAPFFVALDKGYARQGLL